MDPVHILPEEVWGEILGKLSSFKDLQNAYHTCRLWRSLLKSKRKEWMFQAIIPSLSEYLPTSDILNTRLVSKSWSKGIGSYLEEDQPSIILPGSTYLYRRRNTSRIMEIDFNKSAHRLGFSLAQVMQRFQDQFASSDASRQNNPFISRSLWITVNGVDVELLKFLEKFGTHLWSLHLCILQHIPSQMYTPVEIPMFIWVILRLVPNLKKLDLQTRQVYTPFALSEQEKISQVQQVWQFFSRYPAPPLPHLKNLLVNVLFPGMREILETAYSPRLTSYVYMTTQESIPENLRNLQESVWIISDGCTPNHTAKLKNLNCPALKRLHVSVIQYRLGQENVAQTFRLFDAMESFRNTLTHVSLFWWNFDAITITELNLPFVQEFCFEMRCCRFAKNVHLSFLTGLKSLRKLKCVFWENCYLHILSLSYRKFKFGIDEFWRDNVDLHYHLFRWTSEGRGPYDSNIWRLIPTLEVIEIQVLAGFQPITSTHSNIHTKVYTRAQRNRYGIV